MAWTAETREEIGTWLAAALNFAREVARSGPEGLVCARGALQADFRDLWPLVPNRADLADLMREVAAGGWSEGWVAARGALRFDGKGMPSEVRDELRALCDALAPQGLAQETLAFTGGSISGLDIADTLDDSDDAEDGMVWDWGNGFATLPEPKAVLNMRIDRDVLEFFKTSGKGYQTKINAVLRAYKEAHSPK